MKTSCVKQLLNKSVVTQVLMHVLDISMRWQQNTHVRLDVVLYPFYQTPVSEINWSNKVDRCYCSPHMLSLTIVFLFLVLKS